MKTSRQVVVEALMTMDKNKAWSGPTLDTALERSSLTNQDKAFVSAMFYGTIARRYTIDHCISQHSKTPIKKMDAAIINILRTAFFQLLYMDSVPEHAAVNEAVSLCKKMRKSSVAGFVNAILRTFLRNEKKIPPPNQKNIENKLAVEFSCPPEVVKLFLLTLSEEDTKKMLENSLEVPPNFIRVNSVKTTTEDLIQSLRGKDVSVEETNAPHCLVVEGVIPHFLAEYDEGLFHVQDISSQRVALYLGAQPQDRILDCCAAPGGKSFVLAEEMDGTGEVVACDIYPHRTAEISRRQRLLGLTNIKVETKDMTTYYPELGEFDRVICDAPCSGYGTIRRNPEIKYQLPKEFSGLPELQLKLLNNAGKYCKKGGILVYSTCTLSPVENHQVVEKFLENNGDFSSTHGDNLLGKTIFLGQDGGDGFFYAILKRS